MKGAHRKGGIGSQANALTLNGSIEDGRKGSHEGQSQDIEGPSARVCGTRGSVKGSAKLLEEADAHVWRSLHPPEAFMTLLHLHLARGCLICGKFNGE